MITVINAFFFLNMHLDENGSTNFIFSIILNYFYHFQPFLLFKKCAYLKEVIRRDSDQCGKYCKKKDIKVKWIWSIFQNIGGHCKFCLLIAHTISLLICTHRSDFESGRKVALQPGKKVGQIKRLYDILYIFSWTSLSNTYCYVLLLLSGTKHLLNRAVRKSENLGGGAIVMCWL